MSICYNVLNKENKGGGILKPSSIHCNFCLLQAIGLTKLVFSGMVDYSAVQQAFANREKV